MAKAKMVEAKPVGKSFNIPKAFECFAKPSRYKIAYGGRASAKSWTFAKMLVGIAFSEKKLILCAREFQNSIKDSVHRLLAVQIQAMGLQNYFSITEHSIKSWTGAEFIFRGFHPDPDKIKSLEGADICWVEEGQNVSQKSWDVLIPTIRQSSAEIWVTFNPDSVDDPVWRMFVDNPPPDAIVAKINFTDNPYFDNGPLRTAMEFCKRVDFAAYQWIWEGTPRAMSEAVVFKNRFRVEAFDTPDNAEFFIGADWGFSNDPTTAVRCFVKDRRLHIDHEAYEVGCTIPNLPALMLKIPAIMSRQIIADNARPELVNIMQSHGFRMKSAMKGPGSIERGIDFLKSFEEIVIHERCINTAQEFKLYSYKLGKDLKPTVDIVDKHNHCIDALRYALEPLSARKGQVSFAPYTGF